MNYTNILKRTWQILWRYPALWVFGIFLAISGSSSKPANGQWFTYRLGESDFMRSDLPFQMPDDFQHQWFLFRHMIQQFDLTYVKSTVAAVLLLVMLALLLMIVVTIILKYISLTANIRMVDHLETSGEKVSWTKGLRWGWSARAFRLFLINLVLVLPTVLVILILLGATSLPVIFTAISGKGNAIAGGIIATIVLAFLAFTVIFLLAAFIGLLINFARRFCVLEDKGVFPSINAAWKLMRTYWKDILIMWLILVGVRIGVGLVLIPIVFLLLAVASILGGGLALIIHALAAEAIIATIIAGILVFITAMSLPLLFINGLVETYFESAWTLIYRETRMLPKSTDVPAALTPSET